MNKLVAYFNCSAFPIQFLEHVIAMVVWLGVVPALVFWYDWTMAGLVWFSGLACQQ